MPTMNKKIGLVLLLITYGLLVPGLTLPLLSLTGIVERIDLANIGKDVIVDDPDTPDFVGAMAELLVEKMEISGTVVAYQKTRSILGTVEELYINNHAPVAFLVALFSIIIPALKGVILLITCYKINPQRKLQLQKISVIVSKWSMADVFLIGVFVAFLAANAVEKESGLLTFDARLGAGFYFFLGYCLLSILATQMLISGKQKTIASP